MAARIHAYSLLYLSALAPLAHAQAPAHIDYSRTVSAAMADSIRQQRESIERQLRLCCMGTHWRLPREGSTGGALETGGQRPPDLRLSCAPLPRESLDSQIRAAAREQGLSPDLLRAVITVESASLPCAVSSKGAIGLMQLMPDTAQVLGVADPLDPGQNLIGGAKYLNQMLTRYGGDLRLALGAYNAGPGVVDKYGDVPPFAETQRYVLEILKQLGSTSSHAPPGPASQE